MRYYLTLSLFILCVIICSAEKVKIVSTEYIYYIPENVSIDQAKATALYRAKIQALADEFGTLVTQTTSTYVTNENGNTNSQFFSLGGSDVKGEWIEDCGAPEYEMLTDGGTMAIRVKIKGKAREIKNAKVAVDVKILRNGITTADETDRFTSGDDIYMQFKSPVSGYLAIYLLDAEDNAFCLLPYEGQTSGIFKINANKNYLLFHSDYADGLGKELVDGIIADTSRDQELNRIVTIFSPNKFYKGNDTKASAELPRSMTLTAFQKWLSDVRKADVDLMVSEKQIFIYAKE